MYKNLFLSVLFFFICFGSFAQSADLIYPKVNKSIVTIYTFDSENKPVAQGSGVILSQKGWIVTNYHVYNGAAKIIVKQKNRIISYSEIVAADENKDILILKILKNSLPIIPIGNSNNLKIGQKIYAIGTPLGMENSMSEGIISGLRSTTENSRNYIQISAAISPGSSGGAVVNEKGELIGITTSTFTKGQNLNFAIPINDVIDFYNSQIKKIEPNLSINTAVLYQIKIDGKFGFINRTGKLIVEPIYDDAREFHEGLAAVKSDGKWGYIDNTGKLIIPLIFNTNSVFEEGMAFLKVNDKYGFFNKKGEIVIQPQFYDFRSFSEDLSAVCVEYKSSTSTETLKLYGFIDKKGKFVIKPQFLNAGSFQDGLAPVSSVGYHGWGFINKMGKIVIPYQFMKAHGFHEGIALVENINNDYTYSWGGIDKTGKFIITPKFNYVSGNLSDGLCSFIEDEKYGFFDKNGRVKVNNIYDFASDFSEGVSRVKKNGKYGFINKIGEYVINPIYDFAAPFEDGLAMVQIKDKWGYIDHLGKWIWKPLIKEISSDENNPFEYGFKSIKIGDKKSTFNNLVPVNTKNTFSTFQFKPEQDDLYNLFDLRLDQLNLTFNNRDQLVEIILIKKYSGANSLKYAFEDAAHIDPDLITILGKQTGIIDISNRDELKVGRLWKRNLVTVKSYGENYGLYDTDLKVSITDNLFIGQLK